MWDRLQKYLRKLKEPKAKRLTLDEMWGIYQMKEHRTSLDLVDLLYPKIKHPVSVFNALDLVTLGLFRNGYHRFEEFIRDMTNGSR